MLNIVRGNTRGKIKEKREIDINDQTKLPKRKKNNREQISLFVIYWSIWYFVD